MKPILALFTLLLLAAAATPSQSLPYAPGTKQLTRAAALVAELESFEVFLNRKPTPAESKTRSAKLVTTVEKTLRNLPDSDTKIDIATAAHFYELAANAATSLAPNSKPLGCDNERPGTYRRICEETSGSEREFLRAKARLHLSWARCSTTLQRTCTQNADLHAELENQRRGDAILAAHAIQALKVLQKEVVTYSSLAGFEENHKLAQVPFETFSKDLREVTADVDRILAWLPQSRIRVEIRNTLLCYQDAFFWWRQIDQRRVVDFSELVVSRTNTTADTAFLTTIPYTVVTNWRQASNHLKQADALLVDTNGLRPPTSDDSGPNAN